MRRSAAVALTIAALAAPVVDVGTPRAAAAVLPGFTDTRVASLGASTGIAGLPDGRIVVLEQAGRVRLLRNDSLLPTPALTLDIAGCNSGERGLLGVAVDPDFLATGFVYLYYTRPSPGAPGDCVNRASRFTMFGDAIDPASEVILVDNISSNNRNHNGGDLEIGGDGFLYISVGDAGADPR
ncbi:MAG TPA: PQQ-dependent sugar dehydrogenase, partial [Ilumatobacteraceae bacterium]|nr:PQQ-dependent sugar dehydrogenase [Ilumatobacteraceae bacterium]